MGNRKLIWSGLSVAARRLDLSFLDHQLFMHMALQFWGLKLIAEQNVLHTMILAKYCRITQLCPLSRLTPPPSFLAQVLHR